MKIYLDLLLLENFIVNYFLIHLTLRSVNIKCSCKYKALSSLLGSLSCIIIIFYSFSGFVGILLKFIIAFLMIYLCIRRNLFLILKSTLIFISYSMVLAGLCIFIKFNELGYMPNDTVIVNFTYKKLLICIMLMYLCVERLAVYVKDRKDAKKFIYIVDISVKDNIKSICAFLDTGNELREPATNLPVIIVEEHIFNNIIIPQDKVFHIPYRVINGYSGDLIGFKPDYINIHVDKHKVETKEAIIACCKNKLSTTGDYNALLSRGIF